jgi:hypothetical protein
MDKLLKRPILPRRTSPEALELKKPIVFKETGVMKSSRLIIIMFNSFGYFLNEGEDAGMKQMKRL